MRAFGGTGSGPTEKKFFVENYETRLISWQNVVFRADRDK